MKKPNGQIEEKKAIVIDFTNTENNDFLAIKEMKIHGDLYRRRTDIVGFVNGIPLLFIELKKNSVDVQNAYTDNYTDYLDTIPHLFYYNAFLMLSNGTEEALIWISAIIRIAICMLPQNHWCTEEGNMRLSVIRNGVFAITGIGVIILYAISGNAGGYHMTRMVAAILISFGCYLPVTLFSKKKPMVGILMIPKTCAYMWIIIMGSVSRLRRFCSVRHICTMIC